MLNKHLAIIMLGEALLNKHFGIKSQKGVTMIEYALIAALIAIVVIAALTAVGGSLTGILEEIQGALD